MTPKNFEGTIRGFQRRVPFRSFVVELVSGDRIRVDHPEALVLRGGVGAFISKGGELSIFDHEGVSQVFHNGKHQPSA